MRSTRMILATATIAGLAACARGGSDSDVARDTAATGSTVIAVDDFGDTLRTGPAPVRIVSLNPSTTEILFTLGVGNRVVGRTHWDVYPEAARAVPDLGDGIRPNVEALLAARPQLVVLYASADNRAAATAARAAGARVVALKIDRIADFARAVQTLAAAVGEPARGQVIVDSVSRTIAAVRAVTTGSPRPRVLWPLVDEPLYVIGAGSFLSEIIDAAGGTNAFADLAAPSPQMSREEVLRRDADAVLASPHAAARIRSDPGWRGLTAVRTGRVYVADTALVERPSVRLGEATLSVAKVLHPELRARLDSAVSARTKP